MDLPLRWRFGDSAQAHKIEADLEKRYPEDTSVQFSYLPALRALEALNQGDPAKALEMTQVATPYDLAVPATAFYTGSFFGALYPVYVRGLAYSRMGRHREAAAEFQKILDHPGIVLNDPIGPWRVSNWPERCLLPEIARNQPPSTRICSLSGRMPIPIFRWSKKPRLSPPD